MHLTQLLSPAHLVTAYGLIGVIAIIFAETGLLIGFFFPGDSLLFLAGAYAATSKTGQPHLALLPLLIGVAIASILGGQVGYWIGQFAGERLFSDPNHKIFRKKYIDQTKEVLERYGEMKAVLIARVIPVVRTFISPVVGAIGMPLHKFVIANVAGGLVWSVGVIMLGFALGSSINIDKYILPITAIIIIASVIPLVLEYRRQKTRANG